MQNHSSPLSKNHSDPITPAYEASYLKEAHEFVTKKPLIQMAGVQRAFLVFLEDRQEVFLNETDGRFTRLSVPRMDALIPFFVKMFRIGSNLRWYNTGMFEGCWRRTSHHEIMKITRMGRGHLEVFLRSLKKHGLIEVDYKWDPEKRRNKWMWIKVNFQRLKDMLKSAHDWACDHRLFGMRRKTMVKVEVFSDEYLQKQSDVIGTVRSSSISCSESSEVCSESDTKKENTTTAKPGVQSSFGEKKQTIEVDSYTDKVIIHLRKVFRPEEFTAKSVKRVQRLVNSWLYWKKMTEAEVVDFCRLREFGECSWLTTPMTLDFFITRWARIKTAIQHSRTENAAFSAQVDLEHFAPGNLDKLMAESLTHVARRMSGSVDGLAKVIMSFGWNPDLLDMVNTLRLASEMGYDQKSVLEKFRDRFRHVALNSPRYFVLLEKAFPIRQWAQLSWYECNRLREQANRQSFEDHRSVAMHEVIYA